MVLSDFIIGKSHNIPSMENPPESTIVGFKISAQSILFGGIPC